MIIATHNDTPLYMKYGLFTEAPNKRRRRVVSVKRSRYRDYDDKADPAESISIDSDGEPGYEDEQDDSQTQDRGEETGTSQNVDDTTDDGESSDGAASSSTDDSGNTPGKSVQNQNEDDGNNQNAETPDDVGDSDAEEIEIEDISDEDEDYTDGADGSGDNSNSSGSEDPDNESNENGSDGNDREADNADSFNKNDMRKFRLYKRFISMYNTISYCISKLEGVLPDDPAYAEVVSTVLDDFSRLESLTKDYMTLKYKSDSYVQNTFFFENLKAVVLVLMELLKSNKAQAGGQTLK